MFLSQNLRFLLQSAMFFHQLLVLLQQLQQLTVVLHYFLMLIGINRTNLDIPLDNAVDFVQDTLDVIGEKRFCNARRNLPYAFKEIADLNDKFVEILLARCQQIVRHFVARYSGPFSSLLQRIKRFLEVVKAATIDIKQRTKNSTGLILATRKRCAHIDHVEQLLATTCAAFVENVHFAVGTAAEKLAEFPVVG
jgi:hypothetical protein